MEVDPLAETTDENALTQIENEVTNQHAYDFVIQTVYDKCKKEKENKKLTFPLNADDIRVSYYTGAPLSYLERFCITKDAVEDIEFPVDISVRKKVYDFLRHQYAKKVLPTLSDLTTAIQSQLSTTELQKMLTAMGFDYRKTSLSNVTLVENPKIAAQRFDYLKKVVKYRTEKKTIYFLDEAYVHNQKEIVKYLPPTETTEREPVETTTFYYATCNKGLVNVLFFNNRDTENWRKWITHTILPVMEESSVVVMLQTFESSKPISRYSTKEELIKILRHNDVPYKTDMHKSQLYDLIIKLRLHDNYQNSFEDLVRSHGHQILYLPRPLHDLTIGELALNVLKKKVQIAPDDKVHEVRSKVVEFFDTINATIWVGFNYKIEKLEKELYSIEVATDHALEAIE